VPIAVAAVVVAAQSGASAAQSPVGLGTASAFAVLAGTTVTNTGPSVVTGDLGVSPGTAVTGFPPGTVLGAQHDADAVALQAQSDLTTAYNDAAGRTPPVSVSGDLVGKTLTPGVYKSTSSLGLTGTVTLNGEGDPGAVFIFQVASTLITGSASHVDLTGGAQACNIFWQVGSSATLGTHSTFAGNVLALTSISVETGTTVDGRVLARNGQVSLDDNTITRANCTIPPTPGRGHHHHHPGRGHHHPPGQSHHHHPGHGHHHPPGRSHHHHPGHGYHHHPGHGHHHHPGHGHHHHPGHGHHHHHHGVAPAPVPKPVSVNFGVTG
jgi:Ice-binding-like